MNDWTKSSQLADEQRRWMCAPALFPRVSVILGSLRPSALSSQLRASSISKSGELIPLLTAGDSPKLA